MFTISYPHYKVTVKLHIYPPMHVQKKKFFHLRQFQPVHVPGNGN